MLRLFVSLPLPEGPLERCQEFSEALRLDLGPLASGARFARPEALHFTLKFLGDTPDSLAPLVARALGDATTGFAPFAVRSGALEGFPTLRRPRVGYLNVTDGGIEMKLLAERVERALIPLGFPVERRPFEPHLTLLRIGQPHAAAAIGARLTRAPIPPPFEFEASAIELVRSTLRPTGSVYETLARVPFASGGIATVETPPSG